MSRTLSELLGVKGPLFRLNINQLEHASGNPAVDIRLTSEVMQQAALKVSQLGLDPNDTTGPELYSFLNEKVKQDNKRLESVISRQSNSANEIVPAITTTIKSIDLPTTCFALKSSVAKRILKKDPPKATMRRLGYRSLDSLLKREPAAVIFTIAHHLEAESWREKLLHEYKTLRPSDFESRQIEIYHPTRTKLWAQLGHDLADRQHTTVLVSLELGGVVLLPLPDHVPVSTISTLLFCLQAINDIRIHSAFTKLQQVKHDFGSIIAKSIHGDAQTLVLLAGQPIPWHIIQNYYSRYSEDYPLELFEPHVQREDLQLIQIEDVLASIESSFEFWRDSSALAFNHEGEIVSFNIKDVAVSASNNLLFEDRLLKYFRDNLWGELMTRYLKQEHLEENVRHQLDSQLIDQVPEPSFDTSLAEPA